ncbi:MAG TPA: Asp-tRNA(Asn)/Glu-tRNA(Gln) amidotransferase subunit GatA [Leptospiraceae bacterium]|nr:Asp-tRNA(Asn)/Glu-tRNA(Gln) amidotransferase subunit GatA [Leptospiraceae bacterium]HNF27266.1 Asp-tRNA(Asn)/Glu-tRNA(Gln) amidotransferase subunit GatA [Leptospiraceae bacterium]HNI99318.1 Asp-tRNA(Asn)/Glu-tRNA(Gln) amidotransferase subunit GatA [Leptospiraceae bacterium]HNN04597.1 Asp-tRNA(Asn)/Glu-tRNA(Gln) amidotransferase subunit GatA [Leptospiraceae bacterium]
MIFSSYTEIKAGLNSGAISPLDLAKSCLKRIEETEPKIRAFIHFSPERVLAQAEASDKRRKAGKHLSEFDGIPIGIKDNICIEGERTTCGSKILEKFVSPYSAAVIDKLLAKGFILFPGLNMDEFAMGSSTENSAYHITGNPFDTSRIPGGSSGGSAAGVAASMFPVALGSDTGGSIRQPASLCGIYGMKPTYGRVSRYGLVAYASSLDQIGPFSNDPEGIIDVLSVISGLDMNDSTTVDVPASEKDKSPYSSWKGLRIGIMADEGAEWDKDVQNNFHKLISEVKSQGAEIVELDFSVHKYSIPIYYILATAECSSNLSRFDGIRYGHRSDSRKLEDLYIDSRSEGFGKEVKRRILLGTFSLSSGYYDAYYGQAQKARAMIRKSYLDFFKKADFIFQPTSPTAAFKIGEKMKDPIQMYKADILTTSANLGGVPSFSVPLGKGESGLPIGLQITGPHFSEPKMVSLSKLIQSMEFTKIPLPREIR